MSEYVSKQKFLELINNELLAWQSPDEEDIRWTYEHIREKIQSGAFDAEEQLQEENRKLREERDMYKSSSELFYERLKKAYEERNRLFERLKVITNLLGGVTFTDGRQWGAYNALRDILEENEKELSK